MKNQRDWAGLIGGGILIFSLFMPWISGAGFTEKAINITYGHVLLLFGILSCIIAVFRIITRKLSIISYIYPILGILSLWILYLYYGESAKRAQNLVNALPFLSGFVHSFIANGVYVGVIGCIIMIGSCILLKPELPDK
jgi:hypothetical protein